MKLCLSARQEPQYLDWAHEIIFEYRDRKIIPDFIEKYPEKTIILTHFNFEDLDWDELKVYSVLSKNNFLLATNNIKIIDDCKQNQIRFYLAYPICTYDELSTVLDLGSEYVRLGAPLFFDLDNVKKYYPQAHIRLVPNIAYDDGYPREDGIVGTWIRPEDLNMYEPYAEVIEFNDIDPHKERALINIYWETRKWSGPVALLITNFNAPGINRMIPPEFTEKRLNCRQVCKARNSCHLCYRILQLADEERLTKYKEALNIRMENLKEKN